MLSDRIARVVWDQDPPSGSGGSGSGGTEPASTPEPAPTKMVPESQLMALKAAAEKWERNYKDMATKAESHLAAAATAKAELEAARTELESLRTGSAQYESTKAELADAKSRLEQAEKAVLDTRRQGLIDLGLKPEDVKDLTASELSLAESVLRKVSPPRRGAYDRGGNAGSDLSTLRGRDRIRRGLEG